MTKPAQNLIPAKRKAYYVAARVEVDDEGNFSADVRQITFPGNPNPPDAAEIFNKLGPMLWSERITSIFVKAFIDTKLKLFK